MDGQTKVSSARAVPSPSKTWKAPCEIIRVRDLHDVFCEFCVHKMIPSNLHKPKKCNVCPEFTKHATDGSELSYDLQCLRNHCETFTTSRTCGLTWQAVHKGAGRQEPLPPSLSDGCGQSSARNQGGHFCVGCVGGEGGEGGWMKKQNQEKRPLCTAHKWGKWCYDSGAEIDSGTRTTHFFRDWWFQFQLRNHKKMES